MIQSNVFSNITEESFNRLSPHEVLNIIGGSLGLSKLGDRASSFHVETQECFQCDFEIQYVEISEKKLSKPGNTLASGDVIRMVKDAKISDLSGPLPLRDRILGIFHDSIQTFKCEPLQTCSKCSGDKKCSMCGASGNIDCGSCDGNGICANCDGQGKETCPDCSGSGECPKCGGSSTVNCFICDGSGLCNVCEGSGECNNCNGSGRCDICEGTGNCTECDGDGTVQCEWCYGDGEVDCEDCCGTGNFVDDECRKCNGSGTIYNYMTGREMSCPVCGGSGRYIIECRRCNGSGKVECSNCDGDGEVTCEVCHGSGECVTCRGTGNCKVCHGDGKCRKCKGEKKCLRCDGRGDFWCPTCRKHPGHCVNCGGEGTITCTVCDGNLKCIICNGEGKVVCPTCKGSKECVNCGATGKEKCKKCEGEGSFQTYEQFCLSPYNIKSEYKTDIHPFKKSDLNRKTIYSGLFKQWNRNEVESDNSGNIAYSIENPVQAKLILDWINNEVIHNQKNGHYPLYASCIVYKYDLMRINYMLGDKIYSFYIGGTEHTIYYDAIPKKMELIYHKIKKLLKF